MPPMPVVTLPEFTVATRHAVPCTALGAQSTSHCQRPIGNNRASPKLPSKAQQHHPQSSSLLASGPSVFLVPRFVPLQRRAKNDLQPIPAPRPPHPSSPLRRITLS